jgi:hypothetical protein
MAAAAAIQINGTITDTLTGTRVIGPINLTSAAANGQVQQIVLQSGANTITIPTTPAPNGCVIVLPATNTAITTLKGVSGDTGIALGKVTKHVLTWDPTAVPASFVLNSAATQTGLITEITFW